MDYQIKLRLSTTLCLNLLFMVKNPDAWAGQHDGQVLFMECLIFKRGGELTICFSEEKPQGTAIPQFCQKEDNRKHKKTFILCHSMV